MKHYSIEEIIKGVKRRNNEVFKFIYKEVYPSIQKMVLDYNGTEDDAKDIFQESLIILYRKACEPKFKITSSVKSFIYSICKNLWYQKSRNKEYSRDNIQDFDFNDENSADDLLISDEELTESLKIGLLQKYFRKLDRFCQRILQLFYKGKSHEEISSVLKISNDNSRRRKKECLNKLTKLITSDPEYKKYYGF